MRANSEIMTAVEVDPSGGYHCPLCKVQTTADTEDIGWIACPMLDNRIICMGCCFDYEGIARSDNFYTHPAFDDFQTLALQTGVDIKTLRLTCLRHQERLYIGEIERARTREAKEAMLGHLSAVREKLRALGE